MKVTQKLVSGLTIRQDFRDAVRFVLFDTGNIDWAYATHGGTLFIVLYEGLPFAITCKHVLQDFDWQQLIVTKEKRGGGIAGLKAVFYPCEPQGEARGSDVLDVAIIQFSEDISANFFNDQAYVLDHETAKASRPGDALQVAGALKSLSVITENKIAPVYCLLALSDNCSSRSDPALRCAVGKYETSEFSDVAGLSGSPVFNVTTGALCGMVVRGGISNGECTLKYIDIVDILHLLAAIQQGLSKIYYKKIVMTAEVGLH